MNFGKKHILDELLMFMCLCKNHYETSHLKLNNKIKEKNGVPIDF